MKKEDFADAAYLLEEAKFQKEALEFLKSYTEELDYFTKNLKKRIQLRKKTEENYRLEAEERERLRKERLLQNR